MLAKTGRWLSLFAAAALVLSAAGCEFIEEHPKAFAGAGVGAVGGAIVGGLAEGERGAFVGALVGALAGGAIGAYLDHRDSSAAETSEDFGYEPGEGIRVEVVSVRALPATVSPGDEVRLRVTYALMAPSPTANVEVREVRRVNFAGDTVAEITRTIMRTPGTYTSTVPLTLPGGAASGSYKVKITVSAGGESDVMDTAFDVE